MNIWQAKMHLNPLSSFLGVAHDKERTFRGKSRTVARVDKLFSTHPPFEERIAALEKM